MEIADVCRLRQGQRQLRRQRLTPEQFKQRDAAIRGVSESDFGVLPSGGSAVWDRAARALRGLVLAVCAGRSCSGPINTGHAAKRRSLHTIGINYAIGVS